jgi:hypothetical protein
MGTALLAAVALVVGVAVLLALVGLPRYLGPEQFCRPLN